MDASPKDKPFAKTAFCLPTNIINHNSQIVNAYNMRMLYV